MHDADLTHPPSRAPLTDPTSRVGPPSTRSPAELAARLVGLSRRCSRAQHELCATLAEYDLSGHWAFSGAATCTRWAADTLEVDIGTAREWLRVGHALRTLPDVAAAFAAGRLSYAKVRTLTRIAVDHPERQDELVDLASGCTASELSVELARWTAGEEDDGQRDRRHRRDMGLTVRTEPDGAVLMTIRLPPLDGAAAVAAIDAQVMARRTRAGATDSEEHASAEAPTPPDVADLRAGRRRQRLSHAQQRAVSFCELLTGGGGRVVTEVLVHVRGDGAFLSDGTPIAGHLVERLAPRAFLRALIHDAEARPINASGRQRHPTTRQKRVVDERDGYTCTVEGCNSTAFLEHDHEPDYAISGHTVVDELYLRCSRHHRDRHRTTDRDG